MILLECNKVSFSYQSQPLLNDINFSIHKNTINCLVGVNGAGKTTLIWLICNLLEPDSGEIKYLNKRTSVLDNEFKKDIGVLGPIDPLFDYLTIEEHLNYVGQFYNIKKTELKERVIDLLSVFDFNKEKNKLIRELSSGNKRKVGILTTLIHSPALIIWDEPFNGLDPVSCKIVKELILKLKEKGCTFFITSQILEPVEILGDRFLLLNNGKIILDKTSEGILSLLKTWNVSNLENLILKLTDHQTSMPDFKWIEKT